MKSTLLYLLLTGSFTVTFGQRNFVVDSARIAFTIENAGLQVDGGLEGFEASIDFDPKCLDASIIKASVNINTINTGIPIRDKHLKRSDYFDAVNYGRITMTSNRFKKEKSDGYLGYFALTIKQITREIPIHFTCIQNSKQLTFSATFSIKRSDFQLGDSSIILSDIVNITVVVIGAVD